MFLNRGRFNEVNLILLKFLVIVTIGFSTLSYANDKLDPKTVQIISQTVLELQEANPNVKITREMVVNEIKKKRDKEQTILDNKQQKYKELSAKERAAQMMRQAMINLKKKHLNVQITRRMMEQEIGRMQAKAKLLHQQEQEQIAIIKEKLRMLEKEIIEKAIKRKHTEYLEKEMVGRYNISSKKAKDMIMNHDEKAYTMLREIIMNSGE